MYKRIIHTLSKRFFFNLKGCVLFISNVSLITIMINSSFRIFFFRLLKDNHKTCMTTRK